MKIYLILLIYYFSITHEIALKCNNLQKNIRNQNSLFDPISFYKNNTYILMISTNQVQKIQKCVNRNIFGNKAKKKPHIRVRSSISSCILNRMKSYLDIHQQFYIKRIKLKETQSLPTGMQRSSERSCGAPHLTME